MTKLKDNFGSIGSLLKYYITAGHVNGHGIHSPAAFEFVAKVVYDNYPYSDYQFFSQVRRELITSDKVLYMHDIGEPSRKFKSGKRKVSDLVRHTSIPEKYGRLLYRMVKYYNLKYVVELGTSIGLSSVYMARANADVLSIEGNESLCSFAKSWHSEKKAGSIQVVNMSFDDALVQTEQMNTPVELAFIDGDHSYVSTIKYFSFLREQIKNGFIVIDDINWSAGMRRAWQEISRSNKDIVSFDIHKFGIVMLRESITPGAFILRF